MVEGHQCHRVGHAHRKQLLGQRFIAQSPNGRFTEGAAAQYYAIWQEESCLGGLSITPRYLESVDLKTAFTCPTQALWMLTMGY